MPWVGERHLAWLERRVRELEAEIESERQRNRDREDYLQAEYFAGRNALHDAASAQFRELAGEHARHVDAILNRWLTSKGQAYAVEERGAAQAPEAAGDGSEPGRQFTAAELEERDFFVESAVGRGLHPSEGAKAWKQYRETGVMPFEAQEEG